MKKAKLMLSALGVIALLGSAFAFKASTFNQNFIYTGTAGSGVCTTLITFRAICSGTKTFAASTTSLTSGCPDQRVCTLDINN